MWTPEHTHRANMVQMDFNEYSAPPQMAYGYGVPPPPQMDHNYGFNGMAFGPPAPSLMAADGGYSENNMISSAPNMGMNYSHQQPMMQSMPLQPVQMNNLQMNNNKPVQRMKMPQAPSRSAWDDFNKRRNQTVKKQGFTTKESGKHHIHDPPAVIPEQAATAYLQNIGAVPTPQKQAPMQAPMQDNNMMMHLGYNATSFQMPAQPEAMPVPLHENPYLAQRSQQLQMQQPQMQPPQMQQQQPTIDAAEASYSFPPPVQFSSMQLEVRPTVAAQDMSAMYPQSQNTLVYQEPVYGVIPESPHPGQAYAY